jgi:hypothetical protein
MSKKGCFVVFSFMIILALLFTASGVYLTTLIPMGSAAEGARETLYLLGSIFSFIFMFVCLAIATTMLCMAFSNRRYY